MPSSEREITAPTPLTDARGRLNPAAVGWARSPLIDTAAVDARRRWGRTKRWEYWNVASDRFIIALTVSSLDYAGVHELWVYDRDSGREYHATATVPLARGVQLPSRLGSGRAEASASGMRIVVTPRPGGATRLQATTAEIDLDISVVPPAHHESLAVVVPWSSTRFQYTVKALTLPAVGTLTLAGVTHRIDAAWAVLDHGRGWWPYNVRWNWGAGSGVIAIDGRPDVPFGIQVGGKWTDGTGVTENAVFVDGRLYKISADLDWSYDLARPTEPWRVAGGGLDARFDPFHVKLTRTNLGVVSGSTDQSFGYWSGTYADPDGGVAVRFDRILGWAEDVHNRW